MGAQLFAILESGVYFRGPGDELLTVPEMPGGYHPDGLEPLAIFYKDVRLRSHGVFAKVVVRADLQRRSCVFNFSFCDGDHVWNGCFKPLAAHCAEFGSDEVVVGFESFSFLLDLVDRIHNSMCCGLVRFQSELLSRFRISNPV